MKMNKNFIIIIALTMLIFVAGCDSEGVNQNVEKINSVNTNVQKIEVYHFHATAQCVSCKTVGAYAEETINTYFADEVKSGKIVFAHINGDLLENKEKVMQYGVTGSSLWIGVYDENGFHKEENVNVWYKINNKNDYLVYLKSIIDKRLAGDYS